MRPERWVLVSALGGAIIVVTGLLTLNLPFPLHWGTRKTRRHSSASGDWLPVASSLWAPFYKPAGESWAPCSHSYSGFSKSSSMWSRAT